MRRFFYPKSIAIAGVSPDKDRVNNIIIQNLMEMEYPGEIFAVGRKPGEIFGRPIYTSLKEIHKKIDLLVIMVPAAAVPDLLIGAGKAGIDSVLSLEMEGISKIASIGNKLNVGELDLLEYLINDPETKIIVVYLESFVDGRRFCEIANTSSKPIIVFKSNISGKESKLAISHTAALASDDRIVDAALNQAGMLRAW